jgi:hypothetical protein
MSLLQINTAIPLAEPLLDQQQDHERSNIGNNSDIGNKNNKNNNEDERRAELSKSEVNSRIRFVVLGALTGFFIQVVSLGAYAIILVKYKNYFLVSDINTNQTTDFLSMDGFFQPTTTTTTTTTTHNNANTSIQDAFLYTALSVLTQIDLVVYVFIWVAFTCTMTRNGMACIRASFFSSPDSRGDNVRRRYVFVLGVCFLVGLVFGAFAAWSAVDVYLGYPIPFQPIMATVTIDLVLCYLMLWCFDLGGRRHRNTNTNTNTSNNNNNNNGEEMKSESESQYDADDNDDDIIPGMYC